MVEVFKTNIRSRSEAVPLQKLLISNFPKHKINFDLQDCDKVLRIEGNEISANKVIKVLRAKGFKCKVLE